MDVILWYAEPNLINTLNKIFAANFFIHWTILVFLAIFSLTQFSNLQQVFTPYILNICQTIA